MQAVSEDKKIDLSGKNKVLLIYNPKSGSGMFQNNLDKIVAKFQSKGMIVVPLRADGSVSIESFLSGIEESKYRKIIAAGGDGTPDGRYLHRRLP